MVELVQLAFQDWVIAEEAAWQEVVLISKVGGDYRGIGLMEVIWKAVEVILNRRFTDAIPRLPPRIQSGSRYRD